MPIEADFNPLVYEDNIFTCPVTGMQCDQDPARFAVWRAAVWDWAIENPEACMAVCSQSFHFWVKAFGMTFKPLRSVGGKRMPTKGTKVRPFLTWPVQDKAASEIIQAWLDGESVVIRKSRDMGATWLLLAILTWILLFRPDVAMMVVSRIEDDVDKRGNPDTLFYKIDFMLKHLPAFMRGEIERSNLQIRSTRTGSVINGAATTENIARGGRREIIMIDEAAAIDKLEAITASVDDSTSCAVYNSTPKGGSFFSYLGRTGKVRVITLGWWDHPEKGAAGRFVATDKQTGKKVVDGPWRQQQISERATRRSIAENIDIDEEGSGYGVFDMAGVMRQLTLYSRPPIYRGDIVYTPSRHVERWEALVAKDRDKIVDGTELTDNEMHGGWKLWCELEPDDEGRWRPRQDTTYVLGIDIAAGVDASNSVISVGDAETGEKVAEFASNEISPKNLAELAVLAGLWFGGTRGCAFMVWEKNGRGIEFGKRVRAMKYPWLYKRIDHSQRKDKKTVKLGWMSNPTTKAEMLTDYDNALCKDKIKNPCREALEEALRYLYTDEGDITAGSAVGLSGAAKRAHGDRVIADGLVVHGISRIPHMPAPERRVPRHSRKARLDRDMVDTTQEAELDY